MMGIGHALDFSTLGHIRDGVTIAATVIAVAGFIALAKWGIDRYVDKLLSGPIDPNAPFSLRRRP